MPKCTKLRSLVSLMDGCSFSVITWSIGRSLWLYGSDLQGSSLRKQPTFYDTTSVFPTKWCLRNKHGISMLMKWHDQSAVQQYNQPDLGSDRSSLHGISVAQSFLRHHFADLRKQCWRHSMSAVFSGYKVFSA